MGKWIHAHEEDDASHRVFRRAGTPLPPSRGRTAYVIAPDLTARRVAPGADDRPVAGGDYRVVLGAGAGEDGGAGGYAELRVADIAADRLVLYKR